MTFLHGPQSVNTYSSSSSSSLKLTSIFPQDIALPITAMSEWLKTSLQQTLVWRYLEYIYFTSFVWLPKSYITSICRYFSNFHTDFYIDWSSFHFFQKCLKFSFIHISNICCYYFLITGILSAVRWNIKSVKVCIFKLVTMSIFLWSSVSHISSFENILSTSLDHDSLSFLISCN